MKPKIAIIFGTRPEIIRLSQLAKQLAHYCELILINTNQNFAPNLNGLFLSELGLPSPKYNLKESSSSLHNSLSVMFSEVGSVLEFERPDAVVVLGDTNSALASLLAKRMGIVVYHLEAGNRSFDENVPEEINRRVVDHFADFNLCYSAKSAQNLIAEGLHPRRIAVMGSPLLQVFNAYKEKVDISQALETFNLTKGNYLLFSFHRQENVDNLKRLRLILASIQKCSERFAMPVLVSTHPRTLSKLDHMEKPQLPNVTFTPAMGYFDFVRLQMNSYCVVSDSGSLSEEAAILSFKAVTLRDSMERPEALESGSLVMSGLEPENLLQAIEYVHATDFVGVPSDYQEPYFAEKVIKFILSTYHLSSKWHGINL